MELKDERGMKELRDSRNSQRRLRGRRVLEMRQRNGVRVDKEEGGSESVELRSSGSSDEDR